MLNALWFHFSAMFYAANIFIANNGFIKGFNQMVGLQYVFMLGTKIGNTK